MFVEKFVDGVVICLHRTRGYHLTVYSVVYCGTS